MDEQQKRAELRNKLRSKIGEKKIQRSSKEEKEKVVDKTFAEMGIDKDTFKDAMKMLNKSNPQQRQQILRDKMNKVAQENE